MLEERRILSLGGKDDLVPKVGHAIVDRRSGQHQHTCFHAFADHFAHQPVVARLAADPWRLLVAKIMRLIDDHEVVVAPINVCKIHIAR